MPLIPYVEQGGCFTVIDVHWVKRLLGIIAYKYCHLMDRPLQWSVQKLGSVFLLVHLIPLEKPQISPRRKDLNIALSLKSRVAIGDRR